MTNYNSTAGPVVIDARFAGGAIIVERDDEYTGDGHPGVLLELPGKSVWLFPREARALAAALTKHATSATATIRRRTDVVNDLIELEG